MEYKSAIKGTKVLKRATMWMDLETFVLSERSHLKKATYCMIPFFKKDFISLFFREGKGERKRGRETSVGGCLLHAPYWGPGLKPRHVS